MKVGWRILIARFAFALALLLLFRMAWAVLVPGEISDFKLFIAYVFLAISVAQTIFLIIYDFLYISRPPALIARVSENSDDDEIEEQVNIARAEYFFRAYLYACAIILPLGVYAILLALLGVPESILFILIGLAAFGYFYILLRADYSWGRRYLETEASRESAQFWEWLLSGWVEPKIAAYRLWALFMVIILLIHISLRVDRPPQDETVNWLPVFLVFLVLSIAQTLFIVAYDIYYVSRPHRIRITLQRYVALDLTQEKLFAKKTYLLARAFTTCCCISAVSVAYALFLSAQGCPIVYAHMFMGFAYVGLIYTYYRFVTCWNRLYTG